METKNNPKKDKKVLSKKFSIIILVILVLITGWMVWVWYALGNDAASNNQNGEVSLRSDNQPAQVPEGWVQYTDGQAGVSFAYPKDWQERIIQNKGGTERVEGLISPDFSTVTDGDFIFPATGYWFEHIVTDNEFNESINVEGLESAKKAHGGDHYLTTIDGQEAVISTTKTHGSHIWAQTYANGKSYYFRLNVEDEDDPAVRALFEKILSTVDLL